MASTNPSIVIFDKDGHSASMQKSILRSAGLANNSAVENEKSLLKDLVIGRDVLLLNWEQEWDGAIALIKMVRDQNASPDPMVGIVVISSKLDATHARAALNVGVNTLIRAPFNATEIVKHVQHVTNAPWRFVRAPSYFGPDRRRRSAAAPEGGERRHDPCEILEGDVLAKERTRMRSTAIAAFEMMVAHQSKVG